MLDKKALERVIFDRSIREELARVWPIIEDALWLACSGVNSEAQMFLNKELIYRRSFGNGLIRKNGELSFDFSFYPFGKCEIHFFPTGECTDETLQKNKLRYEKTVTIIHGIYKSQIEAQWKAMNLAHEMSSSLTAVSILCEELERELYIRGKENFSDWSEIISMSKDTLVEAQLGQYVVANFLSNASKDRFTQEYDDKPHRVNLADIVATMCRLHESRAKKKGIDIAIDEELDLPLIFFGNEYEIRRALHNALSNAIKYSFHSTRDSRREIRIYSKNPYDPGFSKRRFAICLENYGSGVTKDEMMHIFKAGFRGEQARSEVVVGSGIGLSEIRSIMQHHGGDVRLKSEYLHTQESDGVKVYKTTCELIFPSKGALNAY